MDTSRLCLSLAGAQSHSSTGPGSFYFQRHTLTRKSRNVQVSKQLGKIIFMSLYLEGRENCVYLLIYQLMEEKSFSWRSDFQLDDAQSNLAVLPASRLMSPLKRIFLIAS